MCFLSTHLVCVPTVRLGPEQEDRRTDPQEGRSQSGSPSSEAALVPVTFWSSCWTPLPTPINPGARCGCDLCVLTVTGPPGAPFPLPPGHVTHLAAA